MVYTLITLLLTFSTQISAHSPERPLEEEPKELQAWYAIDNQINKTAETAHMYKGTAITPDSILGLLPAPAEAERTGLESWLKKHEDLVSEIVHLPVCYQSREEAIASRAKAAALIKQYGLKNISDHNYVFSISVPVEKQEKRFVVKIAGPANRKENYNAFLGKKYGSLLAEDEYKKLEAAGGSKTYQTVSRPATFLRLREWIEQNPQTKITTPRAFLMPVPGAGPEVHDKHYVHIEDYVENKGTPDEHPEICLEQIPEMAKAIIHTGLWNIAPRQFLITPDGKVACIDLEQPNNTPASEAHFFHKNPQKYAGNTRCGLGELARMEQELQKKLPKTPQ